MEIVVFVLIAMAGVGVESKSNCTEDEEYIKKCMSNYQSLFKVKFGKDGLCNRTLITTYCGQYSTIVNCTNEKHSDKECVVKQFDDYMGISCNIPAFEAACPSAPKLNSDEHLTGTSPVTMTPLLLMFCSLLVCKWMASLT